MKRLEKLDSDTSAWPTEEEESALLERVAAGDQAARQELILRTRRLVSFVLKQHRPLGFEWADLVSMGYIGLIEAVDRFDLSHRVRFATFAAHRIRGAIWNETRNQIRSEKKHGRPAALDRPVREGKEDTLGDFLPTPGAGPDEHIADEDEVRTLRAAVAALPDDLRQYVALRFGGDVQVSQITAGRALGWSQMTAHRREKVMLARCRAALGER